jgi:integrase
VPKRVLATQVSPDGGLRWTLHDLRRTFATTAARLGIAPHVVEKCLNHSGGTIRGVAAVYNRYAFDAEKRQALEVWARHLTGP